MTYSGGSPSCLQVDDYASLCHQMAWPSRVRNWNKNTRDNRDPTESLELEYPVNISYILSCLEWSGSEEIEVRLGRVM